MSETSQGLRSGALGAFGAVALGCVMMAPALGIYANLGPISGASGNVAPLVFLVSLLCILPTAISFAQIARELPSAGSAYTWLSLAISPFVGTWMGLLLLLTFFSAIMLQPILFGLFFNELLASVFQAQASYATYMIGAVICTLLVARLTYPGIKIAAMGSLVATVFEAAVVFALGCTLLLVLSSHGQVSFASFNPLQTLHGGRGFAEGLVFGILSFVGFGVIATAAEETHAPRTIIPRAMVLACVALGLFWAFTSWGFCSVLKPEAWGRYMAKGVNPVAVIAQAFWHQWSVLVIITAITAVFGVYLASVVGYARVAYAMGRDATLPHIFAKLHPKYRVPWNAQHVVFITTLLVAAIWGHWLGIYESYEWWGSVVVFFAMFTYIFVNIGCTVYFNRYRREQFNKLWHGLIPFLGLAASILPFYYSFGPNLWNAGWKRGQSIIMFCILVTLLSAVYTTILSRIKPDVLRRPATSLGPETEEIPKI